MPLPWQRRILTVGGKYVCYMGICDIKITLPVEHGHQHYTDSQTDLIREEFISWFIKSTEKYIYSQSVKW